MSIDRPREGKMPLNFHGAEPFLNPVEQTICWNGDDGRRTVPCKVTSSAIDALYGTTELAEEDRWIIFNAIEVSSRLLPIRNTMPIK